MDEEEALGEDNVDTRLEVGAVKLVEEYEDDWEVSIEVITSLLFPWIIEYMLGPVEVNCCWW